MRVAIDTVEMRVTHLHPDTDYIHALVYLEGNRLREITFDSTGRPEFLHWLAETDLRRLYLNMTGAQFPAAMLEPEMRQVLADVFDNTPPRQVSLTEIEAQIEFVKDRLGTGTEQFLYVYGSRRPQLRDEGLFPLRCAPASAGVLAAAPQRAQQQRSAPAAPTAAANPAPRAQRPPIAPRAAAGSIRPQVWAEADRMWTEAGKPMDKAVVLELRKKIMEVLEGRGIKRTSSSNMLGDWMKDRLG